MKSHFSEMIVFHQPYQKNSPEIVYSSFISVQDVNNRSAIQNNTESSTPQANYLNQPLQDPSAKLMLYRTVKLIKDQIKHCKGMSFYPVNVNDINLETAKLIVPTDVYLFYDG